MYLCHYSCTCVTLKHSRDFSACTCYNVSMGMVSENITPLRENLLEVKGWSLAKSSVSNPRLLGRGCRHRL